MCLTDHPLLSVVRSCDCVTCLRQVDALVLSAPTVRLISCPLPPPVSCVPQNVVVASYIIGTITVLVVKRDEATRDYRSRRAVLDAYNKEHHLPKVSWNHRPGGARERGISLSWHAWHSMAHHLALHSCPAHLSGRWLSNLLSLCLTPVPLASCSLHSAMATPLPYPAASFLPPFPSLAAPESPQCPRMASTVAPYAAPAPTLPVPQHLSLFPHLAAPESVHVGAPGAAPAQRRGAGRGGAQRLPRHHQEEDPQVGEMQDGTRCG